MSRVLVGIHQLELGGSQLNALDLAAGVRERGHEVEIFAAHTGELGPMAEIVRERGFELTVVEHPADRPGRLPCRAEVARALTRQVERMGADLVHAYEYPLILDAFYGPARVLGTPLVGTVYAMAIPSWLPRSISLVAGTEKLVADGTAIGQRVTLIEPPVDLDGDDPATVDGGALRSRLGIAAEEVVLGIVSRLNADMKEEGIARAIDAVGELERGGPRLRLLITGDGPARPALAARAAALNQRLGREAVILTGAMEDPRPAYAAADVALGMGGSALRSMAFAKPLIVLGIHGFSLPFDEDTAELFLAEGFYGVGDGSPSPLAAQIEGLLEPGERRRRGEWSRRLVRERYGLEAAVDELEAVFTDALGRRQAWLPAALRPTVQRSASELAGPRLQRRLGPVVRWALAQRARA